MSVVAKANAPAVTIRFPSRQLLKRLKSESARAGRSLNSEVVYRLSKSLDAPSLTESTAGK